MGHKGAIQITDERLDLGPYEGNAKPLHLIARSRSEARVYAGPKEGLKDLGAPGADLLLPSVIGPFSGSMYV